MPPKAQERLVAAALREPLDSPARLHLLSSAYVHAPADRLHEIKKLLVEYARTGTEADKTEMCNALAQRVSRDDLPLLQSLLEDETMDVPATAAHAILKWDRKQRSRR